MDSFGDLLHLLRSYFEDDFSPTKIIELYHNTVKLIVYSEVDTCARLRIEKRNGIAKGYTDRLIYLNKGLNALCLCQTFPYPGTVFQFQPKVNRGMTRMRVRNRYMSGITVKLIIGPLLNHHDYYSDRVVEERFMKEDTFKDLFLRRVAIKKGFVEQLVIEMNKNVKSLSSLALREGALIGLDHKTFWKQIAGHVTVQIQEDYRKYSWTPHMHRFLSTSELINDNYTDYTDRCWNFYQGNGHHFSVTSETLTIY